MDSSSKMTKITERRSSSPMTALFRKYLISPLLLAFLIHHSHRSHNNAYCFAYSLLRTTNEPVTQSEIGYGDDLAFADAPPLQPNNTELLLLFANTSDNLIPRPRVVNLDTRFTPWSRRFPVPYFIDTAYSTSEENAIQSAFEQIEQDLQFCVQFKRIFISPTTSLMSTSDNLDNKPIYGNTQYLREQRPAAFLYVTPFERGVPTLTCYSFPGMVRHQRGRGQIVSVARGDGGCSTNKREIMKVIVHSLGLRNVHRRADRDTYIQVMDGNIDTKFKLIQPFSTYRADQATSLLTSNHQPAIELPYDYNSITHHQPTQYAKEGTVVFTTRNGREVGNLARLSYWDCVALKWIYYCDKSSCRDPYGDISSSTTTTTAISTTSTSVSPGSTTASSSAATTTTGTSSTATTATTGSTATTTTTNPGSTSTTTTTTMGPAATTTTLGPGTVTSTTTTTMPPPPTPPNVPTTASTTASTTTTTTATTVTTTPQPRSNEICSPAFAVDAAMLASDSNIYLFSGDNIWKMDQTGIVDPDGPSKAGTVLLTPPPDRKPIPLPIKSAWFDGLFSQIVDANGQQWQTDVLTVLTQVVPPTATSQVAAFSTASNAGGGAAPATRDNWFVENGMIKFTAAGTPMPLASVFPATPDSRYPSKIDAAFGFRFGAEELVVVYDGNSYYILKPCPNNSPTAPCLELHETGVYPLPIASQVQFAGNC